MSKKRTAVEVFSLSFLDIIACAFGAVVMLILLAKGGDETEKGPTLDLGTIEKAIVQAEQEAESLAAQLKEEKSKSSPAMKMLAGLEAQVAQKQAQLQKNSARIEIMNKTAIDIKTVKNTPIKNPAPPPPKEGAIRGQRKDIPTNVGGLNVAGEYVAFVVDTSGSMESIRPQISKVMADVMRVHPKVKGIQLFSDSGKSYWNGQPTWQPDTSYTRDQIVQGVRTWATFSADSSPTRGIIQVLQSFKAQAGNITIYVFGDDFRENSFDRALARINAENRFNGKQIAVIHGVGIESDRSGVKSDMRKFTQLMREVSAQNGGSFITLN